MKSKTTIRNNIINSRMLVIEEKSPCFRLLRTLAYRKNIYGNNNYNISTRLKNNTTMHLNLIIQYNYNRIEQ